MIDLLIVTDCVCVGWPQLHWFVTDHLSKPPKDWLPPPRPSDNAAAYIEVTHMYLARGVAEW